MQEKTSGLKEKAEECVDDAKDQANDIQQSVSQFVSDNPIKVVSYTFLTGMLMGLLIKRARKN